MPSEEKKTVVVRKEDIEMENNLQLTHELLRMVKQFLQDHGIEPNFLNVRIWLNNAIELARLTAFMNAVKHVMKKEDQPRLMAVVAEVVKGIENSKYN